MARSFRLAALDLDGTLLPPEPPLSRRALNAVLAVQRAGIIVVPVSSRHWTWVLPRAAEAGIYGVTISSNGALTMDGLTRAIVACHQMDTRAVEAVISRSARACPGLAFAWETPDDARCDAAFSALRPADSNAFREYTESAAGPVSSSVIKVLMRHPTVPATEVLSELGALSLPGVSIWLGGPSVVEFTRMDVSKRSALVETCDWLGVAREEVIAVGNSTSDLGMLLWAGRGVAMGNSDPEVLARVGEHTTSNAEDGVALVLESLLQC